MVDRRPKSSWKSCGKRHASGNGLSSIGLITVIRESIGKATLDAKSNCEHGRPRNVISVPLCLRERNPGRPAGPLRTLSSRIITDPTAKVVSTGPRNPQEHAFLRPTPHRPRWIARASSSTAERPRTQPRCQGAHQANRINSMLKSSQTTQIKQRKKKSNQIKFHAPFGLMLEILL